MKAQQAANGKPAAMLTPLELCAARVLLPEGTVRRQEAAGNVLSATPVRTSLEYLPAQLEAIVRPILAETGQLANLIKTNAKLDFSMTMTMPDKKTTVEAPEMNCGIPVYTNPNKLAPYTRLLALEDLIDF